jgi:hypothetical protein
LAPEPTSQPDALSASYPKSNTPLTHSNLAASR